MKTLKKIRKFLPLSVFLCGIVLLMIHCSSDNPVDNSPTKPLQETAALKSFSTELINAMNSESPAEVEKLIYPEDSSSLVALLEENPEKMKGFAKALESRKLIVMTDLYAEYEIELNGNKITICYGNSGDEKWYLTRL